MSLRVGLTLPQRGLEFGVFDVPGMLDLARRADDSGIVDAVCVGDSIMAKPRVDAVALLGGLAAVTSRVDLAVGCMASVPIRNPLVLAYQWASLDQLSGGRMKMAACTGIVANGTSLAEGRLFGLRTDAERAPRMVEVIGALRRLWSEEDVTVEGTHVRFEGATVAPKPVQDPCPIWIAANPWPGKFFAPALQRVGRLADGWMTSRLHPAMLPEGLEQVHAGLAEADRTAEPFPVVAYHNFVVADDVPTAREEAKRFLDAYYGPVFSEEMIENWVACGPVEAVVEHLAHLADQGVTDIYLRACSWEQERHLELLLAEIAPALGVGLTREEAV